jgi:hypothetical protein
MRVIDEGHESYCSLEASIQKKPLPAFATGRALSCQVIDGSHVTLAAPILIDVEASFRESPISWPRPGPDTEQKRFSRTEWSGLFLLQVTEFLQYWVGNLRPADQESNLNADISIS